MLPSEIWPNQWLYTCTFPLLDFQIVSSLFIKYPLKSCKIKKYEFKTTKILSMQKYVL